MLIGDLSGSVLWPLVAHEIAPRCRSLVSSIAPGGGLVASRQTFVRCGGWLRAAPATALGVPLPRMRMLMLWLLSPSTSRDGNGMTTTNKCLARSNKSRTSGKARGQHFTALRRRESCKIPTCICCSACLQVSRRYWLSFTNASRYSAGGNRR